MKIGILTHPLETNYGGLLQNFAMQHVLRNMGHEVYTVDVNNRHQYPNFFRQTLGWIHRLKMHYLDNAAISPKFDPSPSTKEYAILAQNTSKFVKRNISTTEKHWDFRDLYDIDKDYQFDAYVVGSDQVWLPILAPWTFLNFVQRDSVKRVAYAASFGHSEWKFSQNLTTECSLLAKKFDAISVREDSGVELCEKHLHVKAKHVLDPTMLLQPADYIKAISPEAEENTLFAYVLDKDETKQGIANAIAEQKKLKVRTCMPKESFIRGVTNIEDCIFPAVDNWINGINNAKFVVTDSFHGTVFAILFNKQFVTIGNENRGMARFNSLLSMFGLENRLVTNIDKALELCDTPIHYEEENQILNQKRQESITWLAESLS